MIKVLLAGGRYASSIVGIAGSLRVIDPPPKCSGYANCCRCSKCQRRERAKLRLLPGVQRCECDQPRRGNESRCEKCGHLTAQAA